MESITANKATSSAEEQIGIVWQKTRQSIEREAVDRNKDGIGENRAFLERDPVGVMEVRHDLLTTQVPSINPPLYTLDSVNDVSLPIQDRTKDKMDGERDGRTWDQQRL
jgi:hypothetical protein